MHAVYTLAFIQYKHGCIWTYLFHIYIPVTYFVTNQYGYICNIVSGNVVPKNYVVYMNLFFQEPKFTIYGKPSLAQQFLGKINISSVNYEIHFQKRFIKLCLGLRSIYSHSMIFIRFKACVVYHIQHLIIVRDEGTVFSFVE